MDRELRMRKENKKRECEGEWVIANRSNYGMQLVHQLYFMRNHKNESSKKQMFEMCNVDCESIFMIFLRT